MRSWGSLRDTRMGIAALGLGLTTAFATISAIMFAFRGICEPFLPILLPLIARAADTRVTVSYDPAFYYVWATLPLLLAGVMFAVTAVAWWKKPETDRRIDMALRSRIEESARGAPLE